MCQSQILPNLNELVRDPSNCEFIDQVNLNVKEMYAAAVAAIPFLQAWWIALPNILITAIPFVERTKITNKPPFKHELGSCYAAGNLEDPCTNQAAFTIVIQYFTTDGKKIEHKRVVDYCASCLYRAQSKALNEALVPKANENQNDDNDLSNNVEILFHLHERIDFMQTCIPYLVEYLKNHESETLETLNAQPSNTK